MRCARLVATPLSLALCVVHVAPAQPLRTFHPTITSITNQAPTPGQTITINGSDLLPPTWTVVIQYHDKYGGDFHETNLTGTNSALTFTAPSNMRPDSIALQYRNASSINATANPIPPNEQRKFVPIIVVQQRPRIDTTSIATVASQGSRFPVLSPGTRVVKGQFFLKAPTFSITQSGGTTGGTLSSPITQPTFSTTVTVDQGPTVTVGGNGLSVSDPKYIPTSRDEATISVGTNIPHNTTGFLKFTTPIGSDSMRVTVAQAPQNGQIFESNVNTVTNGTLFAGKTYFIRGRNLVVFQLISGSARTNVPQIALGGRSITDFNLVDPSTVLTGQTGTDTLVSVKIPGSLVGSSGQLTLTHAGGSISLGTFIVKALPAPLQISGAVIAPNEVIGGNSGTVTLSLSPTPADFSNAGELSISVSPSLSSAVAPINSVLITSNPMTITVPTKVVTTTVSGSITISHNTPNGGSTTLSLTVRPPRPTAVVVSPDTIPGSRSAPATVSFDLPGAATVLLSSSDPTVASVPATAARSGSTAAFTINTVQVSSPHTVTISASLNGVSVSKPIVVRPGRLSSITANPSTVIAGDPIPVTMTFDAPVSGLNASLTATDTAIRATSAVVSGTTALANMGTTRNLSSNVIANVNVTAGGVSQSTDVQVRPVEITQFTVSPTSGPGGTTLAATVRLGRAVQQAQLLELVSSDTTLAKVPAQQFFSAGEDVKVITVTLKGPQTTSKPVTLTAKLHFNSIVISTNVSSVRTTNVTVTP